MKASEPNTEQLLEAIRRGDESARGRLLDRHRSRLRQMVTLRLDRRLATRVDPSDVVQEALAEADRRLSDYVRDRPLPFYPWLRAIAWERLAKLHRRHLHSQRRSVGREEVALPALPDESALELAGRLATAGASPSEQALRQERCQRVREALDRLPERDREVLALRYLEQLSTREVAAVLGLSEGAVKTRHTRALQKLHALLAGEHEEDS